MIPKPVRQMKGERLRKGSDTNIGVLFRAHGRTARWIGILAATVVLAGLFLYNQPYYPASWQDEGFVLQGAMNIVRFGQYAMRSSEGFRILDQPLIANGPGVVLPITAAFAVFGIGLLQARLVIILYSLLTLIVFFALARRLFGSQAALISVFLFLVVPVEGFLKYGRHALGNVPALFYFLAGYLIWLTAIESNRLRNSVIAGGLLGLACVTKGQYLLVLPVLLITFIFEWFYFRKVPLKLAAGLLGSALITVTLWYLVQLGLVGFENFGQHLEAIRASSRVTVFVFRPERILASVSYLIRSGFVLFVLPGLVYAIWTFRRGDTLVIRRQSVLVIFILLWLGWYVLASVGWPRYAIEPYLVGLLFAGKVTNDAIGLLPRPRDRTPRLTKAVVLPAGSLVLLITIVFVSLWAMVGQVYRIAEPANTDADRFARYLESNIDRETVIESWEWELDVLAELNYHHPANSWVDVYTGVLHFGDAPSQSYDPRLYHPAYLVGGPFSRWTGLYRDLLASGCCTHIASVGQYDLYRFNSY